MIIFLILLLSNYVYGLRDRLYDATYIGDVKLVEAILLEDTDILTSKAPLKINGIDAMNRTALLMCGFDPQTNNITQLDVDCTNIAKLLIDYGTNISHTDTLGWNAISMGAVRGFEQFCNYILYTISTNTTINHNSNKMIKNMISMKEINHGRTPLLLAAGHAHFNTALLLLKYHSNINVTDNQGLGITHYTLRIASADERKIDIAELFLKSCVLNYNLNINAIDDHGRTGLMYAVMNQSPAAVEMAIRLGADVNIKDKFGIKALYMSSNSVIIDVIKKSSYIDDNIDDNSGNNGGNNNSNIGIDEVKLDIEIDGSSGSGNDDDEDDDDDDKDREQLEAEAEERALAAEKAHKEYMKQEDIKRQQRRQTVKDMRAKKKRDALASSRRKEVESRKVLQEESLLRDEYF